MSELTMCMAGAILLLVVVNTWSVWQTMTLRRWISRIDRMLGDMVYAALKDDDNKPRRLREATNKLLLYLYGEGYDGCGCPHENDEDHDCDIVRHAPECPLTITENALAPNWKAEGK